jgi:predicted permease
VGLSLVLLVAAGLFLRSLQRAATTETGFQPAGAYVTGIDLSLEGYDVETGRAFHQSLLEELRQLSWVDAAALANDLPLDLGSHGTAAIPEGWPADAPEPGLGVEYNRVSPGYFETLGIPVLAGRGFERSDVAGSERVAVVSRTFAQRAWPGEEPLGRTLVFGSYDPARGQSYRVVGVAEDVKNQLITDQPQPFVYTALAQYYAPEVQVVVRGRGGIDQVAPALRTALLDVDPSLSLQPVVELERYTGIGVLPQRVAATLTSALGLVALLLSGLGVYGVVAYAVGQQTREIGIRMALGADRARVLGRVLRGGLWLALPGVGVGALLALGLGQVMRGMLLGLSPFDPLALGGVAVALLLVVGLATWLPARRAASVDPAVALRSE